MRHDVLATRAGRGQAGAGFDLRFNFSHNARCAFRPGDGPRTFGFFISISVNCRSSPALAQLARVSFIG